MIDLHTHILFEADDGATDFEMSVEMCKIAVEDGIQKMIATPHYIVGECHEEHILSKVKRLRERLLSEHINLEVLPGNEIFIDYHIEQDLALGKCLSLNGSKYLLVELPRREIPRYTYDVLYKLQLKGYVPIIAHPERNDKIQRSPKMVYELVANGCLMQVNAMSLMGLFGKAPKKVAERLLKHNLVHFIASDAHNDGKRRPILSDARQCVMERADKKRAEDLFVNHPQAVIRNEPIEIEEPIPFK